MLLKISIVNIAFMTFLLLNYDLCILNNKNSKIILVPKWVWLLFRELRHYVHENNIMG